MIVTAFLSVALQAGSLPVQAVVRDGARERATTAAVRPTARKTLRRVVVDAGHGGPDGGGPMQLSGIHEKDITLQVALKIGAALRERGIHAIYTRTKDTLISRSDRGRIANEASADVFISVHVNAANPRWRNPRAARGVETYFLGVAKTEDARRLEEMENESARFETGAKSESDALGFILKDMEQNQYLRESADFADIVQRRLARVHPGPDRGVKQAGFTVLVTAFMPAILVEIGFGTNAEEARFLASATKQRVVASAIAAATEEYLERYQRRVSGGAASGSHE